MLKSRNLAFKKKKLETISSVASRALVDEFFNYRSRQDIQQGFATHRLHRA